MSHAAVLVFWISLAFVSYVYLGYPLLLVAWRSIRRRPVLKSCYEPTAALILAAHNERRTLADKLRNCLELDYPAGKLEIIVSLDGPADGTEAIARLYENGRIRVLHSRVHHGKAVAINRAAAAAHGEILVFVDARQRLERRAVRELVANFADASVGAVTGELILTDFPAGAGASLPAKPTEDPVGLYWRYEKWLRRLESDVHSVVGATGALYAVRHDLFRPLAAEMILDDVAIPLQTVLAGKRIVFETAARAYDRTACCLRGEFGRKVRTLVGNHQLLVRMPELLAPWRNPIWLQFLSHKVGRLMAPYFLAALFVSNVLLWRGPYAIFLVGQLSWYLLAAAGALSVRGPRSTPDRMLVVGRDYEEGS